MLLTKALCGIFLVFTTTSALAETIVFEKEAGLLSTHVPVLNDLNAPSFPPLPADDTFTESFDGTLRANEAKFFRYDFDLPEGYSNLRFELELNVDDEFAVYINDAGVAMQDDTADENFEDPLPGFVLNPDGSSADTSGGKLDFLSIDQFDFREGKNELTIFVSDTLIDGSFDVMNGTITYNTFQINAGHSGAWFNPDTSGQGQFIDVVPEDQFMFISWFTFTDAASDNPNEQQWYTAQGNYSGDTAVLDLFETLGGKFDDPQEVTTNQVGEVTLTFSDCDMGMMSYSFDAEELEGEFPMIRVIPGSDNVCEGLSGNNTEAVDINAGMDGAWFDPDTSGQGYFIDAYPDPEGGNFIFVSWFTYGDATASGQRWLTAQGGFEGSTAEIDVFETTGGSFDDPEPVSTTKVGTMSLDFTDCSNAQLTYSLPADSAEGDIAITRVIPGSQALCEDLAGAE